MNEEEARRVTGLGCRGPSYPAVRAVRGELVLLTSLLTLLLSRGRRQAQYTGHRPAQTAPGAGEERTHCLPGSEFFSLLFKKSSKKNKNPGHIFS